MNILEVEDIIKGLPDQALQKEAQAPTGNVPQFLVVSEIQRRTDMRKRFQSQQQEQPQGTVSQQIVQEGIASLAPQPPQGMPPQGMPQGMPPQGMPPQGAPQGMPPQGMPPQGIPQNQPPAQPMYRGGVVQMNQGRQATIGLPVDDEEEEMRRYLSVSEAANNPLSIKQPIGSEGQVISNEWIGEQGTYTSPTGDKFVEYGDPRYSFRSADRLLKNYQKNEGINTIRGALNRYTPKKGDTGYSNPTDEYIDYVSKISGIDPDEEIDFQDPVTRSKIVSPMAWFESNTKASPSEIRDMVASIDDEYAASIPERRIDPRVPNIDTSIDIPGQTFEQPRQPVATGDFNVSQEIVGEEPYIPPMYSENRFGGAENMDALLSAIMDGKSFPRRESGERRGSVARLPVKDRQAGDVTKAIAGAIEADAKKTKGSDITEESAELVEGFTAGATGLPVVVAKEKKKSEDLFAGARRAEDLLAGMKKAGSPKSYMPDPLGQFDAERAAALVDSIGEGATRKEFMAGMTGPEKEDVFIPSTDPYAMVGDVIQAAQPIEVPEESSSFLSKLFTSGKPQAQIRAESDSELKRILGADHPAFNVDTNLGAEWRQSPKTGRYEVHFFEKDVEASKTIKAPTFEQDPGIEAGKQKRLEELRRLGLIDAEATTAEEKVTVEKPKPTTGEPDKDVDDSKATTTGTTATGTTATGTTATGTTATGTTTAPTDRSGGQGVAALMSDYGRTRDEAKREAFANAMIQLGAGVAAGDLAGGLSAAGKAASETMKDFRKEQQDERRLDIMKERYDQYASSTSPYNQLLLRVNSAMDTHFEDPSWRLAAKESGKSDAEYRRDYYNSLIRRHAPGFNLDPEDIINRGSDPFSGPRVEGGQVLDQGLNRGQYTHTPVP